MSDSFVAEWLQLETLNEVLRAGHRWSSGPVVVTGTRLVGAEYGFSGRVYRIRLASDGDGTSSLIAKFEGAESIARAVAFHEANDERLTDSVPMFFGATVDTASDQGVVLLEDIRPAVQGDDLVGCTKVQAMTIVRLVARLHAETWVPRHVRPADSVESWAQREWESDRWNDRLTRASSRFPDHFDSEMLARLSGLVIEAADAYDTLMPGPRAWVHRDPHPDNALWRPDGRLVLLDWSNAMIAPPAVDVAVLLWALSFRPAPPISPSDLLADYATSLSDSGRDADAGEIRRHAEAAVRLLIRGSIGWAGSTAARPNSARALDLQAQTAERAKSALRWLDDE